MVAIEFSPVRVRDANDLAQEVVGHCMSFLDPVRDRASLEACSLVNKAWSNESSRVLFSRFKLCLTGDFRALVKLVGASERVRAHARWLDLRPPVGHAPQSVALELQDLLKLMWLLPNLKTVSLRAVNVVVTREPLYKLSKYRGFKLETLELSDVWHLTNCRRLEFRTFWRAFEDIKSVAICNSTEPPEDINDGPITQLARPLPRVASLRIAALWSPHFYVWLKHLFVPSELKTVSISVGNVRFDQVMLYVHALFAECKDLEDVTFDVQMPHMAVYREKFIADYKFLPRHLSLPQFDAHRNLRTFHFSGLSAFPDRDVDGRLEVREQLLWQDLLTTISTLTELRVLCFHISSRTSGVVPTSRRGTLADWHWARLGRVLDGHQQLQRIFILEDAEDELAINPWSYYRDWVTGIADALPVRLLPTFAFGVYLVRHAEIVVRKGVAEKIVTSREQLAKIAERNGPWREEPELSFSG